MLMQMSWPASSIR